MLRLGSPFCDPPLRSDFTLDVSIGEAMIRDAVDAGSTHIRLNETELHNHVAIFGGTRKGKSKLLEMMLRQLLVSWRSGFCLIDPHGDLCDELLGYIGLHWSKIPESKRANIFYLNPTEQLFAFDPFAYRCPASTGGHSEESYYRNWLTATVDRVAQVILRAQGAASFQGMPRLEKFLKAVLYACGVRLDATGTHLPLGQVLVLLDRQHDQYDEVLARVLPHLPRAIANQLIKIGEYNDRDFDSFVGSTENWLTTVLSPIVRDCFGGRAPSLDLHSIVRQNGVLLCNLADSPIFSEEQSDVIGGLLISQLINIARAASRRERSPFQVVVDEAHRFIGQDILDTLGQSSKWKMFFTLAVQDLGALRNAEGTVDLLPKVLSQCNVKMTFQQQHIPDARVLAETFCYPDLDFTKVTQQQQLHDGYEWVETITTAEAKAWERSRTWSKTEQTAATESQSESDGKTHTKGKERGKGTARGVQETESEGVTDSVATTDGSGTGRHKAKGISAATMQAQSAGQTKSDIVSENTGSGQAVMSGAQLIPQQIGGTTIYFPQPTEQTSQNTFGGAARGSATGELTSTTEAMSFGQNETDGTSVQEHSAINRGTSTRKQTSRGINDQTSTQESESESDATSYQTTIGVAKTAGESRAEGGGEGESGSASTSIQKVPLAKYRLVDVASGQLLRSVEDQLAEKTKLIRTLKRGEVLMSLSDVDASICVRVNYVPDAFDGLDDEWRTLCLNHVKRTIWQSHACFFSPEHSVADPAVERQLLLDWLTQTVPGIAQDAAPVRQVETPAAYLPPGCPHEF